MTVTGIGETVLDIIFQNGQPKAAVPGGSIFNAMVSLGRTAAKQFPGVELRMVSQIGDDQVAQIITGFMEENQIGTGAMVRVHGQSSISLALLDEQCNAGYEFFRDRSLPAFCAPELEFCEGDILLFGSFFAINPATRDQVRTLVRKARSAGAKVYYDINFRKNHRLDDAVEQIEENIALSDIVRGSAEDIQAVWGSSDAAEVYRSHIAPACKRFICTRGTDSTEVFSPGIALSFAVDKSTRVVSTIGAGDNFNAGVIYALIGSQSIDWGRIVPVAHRFSANVVASIHNYVDSDFKP